MHRYFFLLILFFPLFSKSQDFSLADTSIIFKDTSGHILNHSQVLSITSKTFNIRKDANDPKVIYLVPISEGQVSKRDEVEKKFKQKMVNTNIPSFEFRDINGKRWSSKMLKGKILVFNFWFTTCSPCIREIPYLNKLVEENGSENVIFLAITFDNVKKTEEFLKKHPFKYQMIPDENSFIKNMKIDIFPTTIIANGNGVIKFVSLGFKENIYSEIRNALNSVE